MPSENQTSKDNQVVVTRDELDISRPEDLEVFLESAEDVYADAVQYQAVAKAEGYESLSFDDVKGEEIFDALFNLLSELQQHVVDCRERVVNEGKEPDGVVVTRLQELYDGMILLRDTVSDTYKRKRRPRVPITVTSSSQQSKQDNRTQLEGIKKAPTEEKDQLFASIEHELETARRQLDVIRARVLNRIPPSARTGDVAAQLDKLKTNSSRLKTLKDRVGAAKKDVKEVPVLKRTFGNYSRLIEEITKSSSSIEQDLMQRQSEATITASSITSHNTSRVRPIEHQEKMIMSESQKTPQEIPSEAEVILLTKRIYEEQFYTEAERQKTEELSESFHRAVASGEQTSVIMDKYQALRSHVDSVEGSPDINQLHDRVGRIIQRMTAGLTFDDGVLRKARSLEHAFRQLESDPENSDERVRNTYVALYEHAKEHERKWLTVCGMHVPLAGPKGIAAARSLRETLLVERDRHGALVRDPKKQVMVDKLIRKLSSIPPSGLSETTDIPEMVRLMRAIDVPGQQGKLVNPAGQSVQVSYVDEDDTQYIKCLGSQNPKHKVMDISVEDDDGLAIEIRVADKAKELIAKQTEAKAAEAVSIQPQIQPVVPVWDAKVENFVVAQTEACDPINVAVPVETTRVTRTSPVLKKRSLTKLYLSDPVYQAFIARYYTSSAAFERMLDTVVKQIEEKTVDAFEKWLQEEHNSPFTFIEELTVGEVLELGAHEDVRQILAEQNIKYETFLAWFDLIEEMQSVVGDDPNIKFGELYARWMIETEMSYYNEQTSR